jgi:hypothetical protein
MGKFQFKRASKAQSLLRMALIGPSGTGKTYSALAVASELMDKPRIRVIDSERGSASLYADHFSFEVLELETFEPLTYVEALHAAATADGGCDIVIVDSLSHAWTGKGGALEQVDMFAKRDRSQNSFAAWRHVTPQHNALVDAMIRCPAHLIVTMRAKTEYVIDQVERNGRTVSTPRKVGLAPVQRDGLEYEFSVVGDIDHDHNYVISKSRCSVLADRVIEKPGEQIAKVLREWLSDGAPMPEPKAETPLAAAPPEPTVERDDPLERVADELIDAIKDAPDRQAHSALAARFPALPKGTSARARAAAAYKARLAELDAEEKAAEAAIDAIAKRDEENAA